MDTNKLEKWQNILKKWEESGLTHEAFCSREKVPLSSFYAWRKKLKTLGNGNQKQSLIPLNIIRSDPSPIINLTIDSSLNITGSIQMNLQTLLLLLEKIHD